MILGLPSRHLSDGVRVWEAVWQDAFLRVYAGASERQVRWWWRVVLLCRRRWPMVSLIVWRACIAGRVESVTWKVTVILPARRGVPTIVPLRVSLSPDGRRPRLSVQRSGRRPSRA